MTLAAVRPTAESDQPVPSFEALYERHYLRLRALAARRFPSCDSDDIAQETMLRLLQNTYRLDAHRDAWPYIATIALNVGRDLVRKAHPTTPLLDGSRDVGACAPSADEPVLEQESMRWVHLVLGRLSPRAREVLNLRALEDLSIGEIARTLEMSENAVRQTLFRARRQCMSVLTRLGAAAVGALAAGLCLVRRARARHALTAATLPGAMLAACVGAVLVVTIEANLPSDRAATALPGRTELSASSVGLAHATEVSALPGRDAADTHTESSLAPGALSAEVETPGSLLTPGRTNREHASVLTPLGEAFIDNSGHRNGNGGGLLCGTSVLGCRSVQPAPTSLTAPRAP